MKKYIVIAGAVGGLGNKIFYAGDEVTEANFPHGNIHDLVKDDFLKAKESEIEFKEVEKPVKKKPVKK